MKIRTTCKAMFMMLCLMLFAMQGFSQNSGTASLTMDDLIQLEEANGLQLHNVVQVPNDYDLTPEAIQNLCDMYNSQSISILYYEAEDVLKIHLSLRSNSGWDLAQWNTHLQEQHSN